MPPPHSASISRKSVCPEDLEALSEQLLQSSTSRVTSPTVVASRRWSSTSGSRSQMLADPPQQTVDSLLPDSLRLYRSSRASRVAGTESRPPDGTTSPGCEDFFARHTPEASVARTLSSTQQLSLARRPPYRGASSRSSNLMRQLRSETNDANARSHRLPDAGLFRKMCSTDVLFLIDSTGSMGPYISAVREQVKSIVADIKRTFLGEADVRIAVVSYKDHGDADELQSLDFTESTAEIHGFVDSLYAGGGGDCPENVLGGLDRALQQSWSHQTRCLVHIADAPPHGRSLNDLLPTQDDYHIDGSEPHGLEHETLIRNAIELNINYALLRINGGEHGTDRMALAFSHLYGVKNASLLPSNLYFHEIRPATLPRIRHAGLLTEPQFEELALGTTYSELRHLVCRTVTSSFARTASRLTMARHGAATSKYAGKSADSIKISLEHVPPRWNDLMWFEDVFDTEGFCPAGVHEPSTLNEMMQSDTNIPVSTAEFVVRARSKPFAHGAMRAASYARTAASHSPFVLKTYLKPGNWRPQMVEDMKIQTLAKAFALEFNGLLNIDPPLDFVVTSCLQSKAIDTSRKPGPSISLEPYITGTYVKYNNNTMWVNPESGDEFNQLVQTFSHFTFERSYGHLLVNDLQGDAVSRTLTDPAIQTLDPQRFKLSDTNLGESSLKLFFVSHECTRFCHELCLISSKEMFQPGATKRFRESWPIPKPTVFCSNKLCRKIMRHNKARESPEYQGYQWCSTCWPQLDLYKKQLVCGAPGEDHEFEVSEFFHQSQGEPTPRECERHRPMNTASSRAAAVGGSMFSRMKSKKSRESLAGSISGRMW